MVNLSEEQLPFGRVSISTDELRGTVDVHVGTKKASELGASSPGKQIDEFIEHMPKLLEWLEEYGRHFPWRYTNDPWKVYVTEILLQRTRANAVEGVYNEFFEEYPDPSAILQTPETDLRKMVKSLGFVNHRVRTLKECAAMCVEQGQVPTNLDKLKEPWRAGEYTARACLLFGYNIPLALVDVNVARVMRRILNIDLPSQPHKDETLYSLMDALISSDPGVARAMNLAILDLAALICKSGIPLCESCPVKNGCEYYRGLENS